MTIKPKPIEGGDAYDLMMKPKVVNHKQKPIQTDRKDFTMTTQDSKTRKAYRQGELVFIPLSAEELAGLNPGTLVGSFNRWKKLDTNILREGEATGHMHEVAAESPGAATVLAPTREFTEGLPAMDFIGSQDRLLVADEPVRVVHPEHRPLALEKAIYLVVIQREYDEVRARRVID